MTLLVLTSEPAGPRGSKPRADEMRPQTQTGTRRVSPVCILPLIGHDSSHVTSAIGERLVTGRVARFSPRRARGRLYETIKVYDLPWTHRQALSGSPEQWPCNKAYPCAGPVRLKALQPGRTDLLTLDEAKFQSDANSGTRNIDLLVFAMSQTHARNKAAQGSKCLRRNTRLASGQDVPATVWQRLRRWPGQLPSWQRDWQGRHRYCRV